MIKELWMLARLLFESRPGDVLGKDLELVVMEHFPFKKFSFMCWCGKVIIRQENRELIDRFLATEAGRRSMVHERGHAVQAVSEHGDNWIRYYLAYFWHWVKHNPLMQPSHACYYCNRYEVEAFAKEWEPEYWENYTRENLRGKYTIKHAKDIYEMIGCTPAAWKEYVRSL